jgi:hypothetical protein
MLCEQNISKSRLLMVKSILSDIKNDINKKLSQVYKVLQCARKSKIELKNSILKIKLISLSGTENIDHVDTLKRESRAQITEALHIFKIHTNNSIDIAKEINSVIKSKQSWNHCLNNYRDYITDDYYNIEDITNFEMIITMIFGCVIQSGEDALASASFRTSDARTFKTKVTVFYVMITNVMGIIINELAETELFLYKNKFIHKDGDPII